MKYYIPKFYLEKLDKLVKALQKKTNVKYEVFEDDVKLESVKFYVRDNYTGLVNPKVFKYLTIGVELEVNYKVGDYEIVAELEHTGSGNIIRQINLDIEVPKTYRDVPCRCEHCNTNRKRNNTFLLVDKDNNFKQVGKNCLNDYTGVDTLSILDKVNKLGFLLNEDFEQDEEFKNYLINSAPKYEPLEYMANIMLQKVLEEGYTKDNDGIFYNLNEYRYKEELEPKVEEVLNVVNSDWYNDDSNYCYNVKTMLSSGYVEPRHWKMLISYINSALNYLQRKIQKQLEFEGLNNDYLGQVGDRITFDIKDIKLLYTSTTYFSYNGETNFTYRIITTTNNVVIWKTTTYLDVATLTYPLLSLAKGTIKKLSEYKGEKQTIVTRVSWKER